MISDLCAAAFVSLALGCLTRLFYTYWISKSYSTPYDCFPPPRLRNQKPFGFDRLEQLIRADAECRLMQIISFYFQQTGHTLEHVFLGKSIYGTIEPANIEALFTKDQEFGIEPRFSILRPVFGDGIFTQTGSAWKHSRNMIRRELQHERYGSLGAFQTAVEELIQILRVGKGAVDLQALFFRLTLDTTMSFLFDQSLCSLTAVKGSEERNFVDNFDIAQKRAANRMRLPNFPWFLDSSNQQQACKEMEAFIDRLLDQKFGKENSGPDSAQNFRFLDTIAQDVPHRAALRGQVLHFLAAGRDTTASLLSWTFFLLVRHPRVMQKLRNEVASMCTADSKLSRCSLKKMTYLQYVLKETLRLYPPIPLNFRTALKDTILPTGGGTDRKSPVHVPRGTTVVFSTYNLHRRPDLYGMDAELFRPERWEENNPIALDITKRKWSYIPFHGGSRTCLGVDFALTEAAYTVVKLLQEFSTIELPRDEALEVVGTEKQMMTLVMSIKNGCMVEIRK